MSTSSNKIPRIELTRERSSTMESIQSLTRAIRESLRLHSVRREKKRRLKKASKGASTDGGSFLNVKDSRRIRSRSMDEGGNVDETLDNYNEISEVGISGVIVSDIGPTTECAQALIARNVAQQKVEESDELKTNLDDVFEESLTKVIDGLVEIQEKEQMASEGNQNRRHSKSVDEFELAHLRKQKQEKKNAEDAVARKNSSNKAPQMSLDIVDHEMMSKPGRQLSMPNAGCSIRRGSKDDAEVTKVDASVLRKRFARLLDTLRSHKFSISSVEEGSTSFKSDSQH